MVWQQTGDKPLPELMKDKFTDASLSLYELMPILVTNWPNMQNLKMLN